MEMISNWGTEHPFLAVGAAAFICGVALFYLVMIRTIKHRENADAQG